MPSLDEDYPILSTIHSAKGPEWQLSGVEFEEVRGRRRCKAEMRDEGLFDNGVFNRILFK